MDPFTLFWTVSKIYFGHLSWEQTCFGHSGVQSTKCTSKFEVFDLRCMIQVFLNLWSRDDVFLCVSKPEREDKWIINCNNCCRNHLSSKPLKWDVYWATNCACREERWKWSTIMKRLTRKKEWAEARSAWQSAAMNRVEWRTANETTSWHWMVMLKSFNFKLFSQRFILHFLQLFVFNLKYLIGT